MWNPGDDARSLPKCLTSNVREVERRRLNDLLLPRVSLTFS
jgi:hypothetical protein